MSPEAEIIITYHQNMIEKARHVREAALRNGHDLDIDVLVADHEEEIRLAREAEAAREES